MYNRLTITTTTATIINSNTTNNNLTMQKVFPYF